jgi:hypothetical protein
VGVRSKLATAPPTVAASPEPENQPALTPVVDAADASDVLDLAAQPIDALLSGGAATDDGDMY